VELFLTAILVLFAMVIGFYLSRLFKRYTFGKEYQESKAGSALGQALSKKQKQFIIIVPLCISLVFVILYYELSEQSLIDFITYGLISTIPNLILISIFYYINRDKLIRELGGNYLIVNVYLLSLIIPFFIYFVIISLFFFSFQIPFKYG
jgi:F0F1-type ATP synthase assembly protein I